MADPSAGSGFQQKTMKRKNIRGLALAPAAPKPAAPTQEDQNGDSRSFSLAGNRHSTTAEKLEIGQEFRLDLRAEDLIVIKELGHGNGGTVSKVQHADTKVIMARKIIHVEAKKEIRKRIVRELQIMHECNSPNIVSFFGAFMNDTGDVIMCMEYMDVGSLDGISKNFGPIRVDVLGKIAEGVLGGLAYLYRAHRIMHRDIKPSNILVNSKGEIKLCDFGVSSELEGSVAETFVGTGTYMAPERIQGAAYTVKSDVWSVGLTLMELAIGKFPFHSDSADEHDGPQGILDLLQQIVLEPSPRLPQSDAFPQIMDDMIAKCLLKDPKERPTPQQLYELDSFIQAAKRTPVDLQAWAVSMMERTNRRSHLEVGGAPSPALRTATPTAPTPAASNTASSSGPSSRGLGSLATPTSSSAGIATPTSGDVDLYMGNLSLDSRSAPTEPRSVPQQHQPYFNQQQNYASAPAPPPSAPLPAAPQPINTSLPQAASSDVVMSATLAGPYSYDLYDPASFENSPPRNMPPPPARNMPPPPQQPQYTSHPSQQSQPQYAYDSPSNSQRPFPARTSSATYGGPPPSGPAGGSGGLGLQFQPSSNGRSTPTMQGQGYGQETWRRNGG